MPRIIRRAKALRPSTVALLLGIAVLFGIGGTLTSTEAHASPGAEVTVAEAASSPTPALLPMKDEPNYPGSPRAHADSAQSIESATEACHYLAYCRWHEANSMPLPDVGFTKMTQMPSVIMGGLAQFIFAIASLGMFIIGMALTFAISVDMLSRAVYTADYLFNVTATQLLGMDNGGVGSQALALVILGLLLMVGAKILLPGISRFGFNLGAKSVVIAFVGVIGLGVMASQSTQNHLGSGATQHSPIARLASGDGSSLGHAPEDAVSTPSNWATFSPGWFVSEGQLIANHFGGVVSDATTGVGRAIKSGYKGQGDTSCDRYIAAMHATFLSTKAADNLGGKGSVLIAYDDLMQNLYFKPYRMAAFGESEGAGNAWCRMAENQVQAPPGEQMMLARTAGLYREAVGTGGLGLAGPPTSVVNPDAPSPDSGVEVGSPSGGTFVEAAGTWTKDSDKSIQAASNYIGPNFRNSQAGTQAALYWAACDWSTPAAWATLNPEWKGVIRADSKDELQVPGDDHSDSGSNDCTSKVMANNTEDGFGADGDHQNRWNYTEEEGWAVVGPAFGWGSSTAADKFAPAATGAGNPALDYYLSTLGSNAAASLVLAIIAAALIWLTIRYFGPIILGAVFSQALAVACMVLASLLVLLLLIPSTKTRQIFLTTVQVLCAALIVSSLLAILFALTFAMTALFTTLLSANSAEPLVQALLAGMGAFLGFWVVRTMVHSLTSLNLGTVSGGIQVGAAAASPALQQLGFDVVNPLGRDFWSWRRNHTPEADGERDLTNDTNSPVSNNKVDDDRDLLTDKAGRWPARTQRQRDRALQDPTKTDRALERAEVTARKMAHNNVPLADQTVAATDTAHRLRDAARDPSTKIGAANAAQGAVFLAARRVLSGQVGDRERGIYLKEQPRKEGPKLTAAQRSKAEMLDSLVPLDPDLSQRALDQAGVVLPTQDNLDCLAQTTPGMRAPGGSSRRSPQEVQLMLHRQYLQMDPSTSVSGRTEVDRLAALAWMAPRPEQAQPGDHPLFAPEEMVDGDGNLMGHASHPAVPGQEEYTPDDLRLWAAAAGVVDPDPTLLPPPSEGGDPEEHPGAEPLRPNPDLPLDPEVLQDLSSRMDRHPAFLAHILGSPSDERPAAVPPELWERWVKAREEAPPERLEEGEEVAAQHRSRLEAVAAQIIAGFKWLDAQQPPGFPAAAASKEQPTSDPEQARDRAQALFNRLLGEADKLRRSLGDEEPPPRS